MASKASFIFGNNKELRAFATASGLQSDLEDDLESIRWLLRNPLEDADRLKAVVITRAESSDIIGTKSEVREISVPVLDPQLIRDTNGAGDAFVGGFLAQWVLGAGLDVAVKCGIWAATHCIKRSGCTMPEVCDFKA